MQMRPPSLYLAQSIRINDGQDEATVGVSGVEIMVRFLKFYINLKLNNLNYQYIYFIADSLKKSVIKFAFILFNN